MKTAHFLVFATISASVTSLGFLPGCGASKPPPDRTQGELPLIASSAAAPPPETPPPPPEPTASAASAASSAAPEKKPRPSGGSPIAIHEDAEAVTTTYGTRGGKIRIGGTAELSIAPDSVDAATNFTLALNTGKDQLKVAPFKGQVGDVYRVGASRPDSALPSIPTTGAPFLLKLPLKGKATANLVLSTGKGKYVVIAPKSVEDGAGDKMAVFELSKIPAECIVHLTSAPPTGAE